MRTPQSLFSTEAIIFQIVKKREGGRDKERTKHNSKSQESNRIHHSESLTRCMHNTDFLSLIFFTSPNFNTN